MHALSSSKIHLAEAKSLKWESRTSMIIFEKKCLVRYKKKVFNLLKGYVSKETVVLRRWGVLQDNLILSTELIM